VGKGGLIKKMPMVSSNEKIHPGPLFAINITPGSVTKSIAVRE
jgi:hypothetical protein